MLLMITLRNMNKCHTHLVMLLMITLRNMNRSVQFLYVMYVYYNRNERVQVVCLRQSAGLDYKSRTYCYNW